MKKHISLLACLLILLASCNSEKKGYTLKIKVDNPKHYTMYLAYPTDSSYVIDTNFTMKDGWAVFTGKVKVPIVASFGVRGNPAMFIQLSNGAFIPGPSFSFFLSNNEISIEGNVDSLYVSKVKGGKANEDWSSIKTLQDEMQKQGWLSLKAGYEAANNNGDSTKLKEAELIRTQNLEKDLSLRKTFIKENPNSLVSMYFLSGLVNELSFDELKANYSKLDSSLKHSFYAEKIVEKITSMEATAIGKSAIPINKTDINGNPVNLETLKGKYVLLDFWGSWCAPCRASFPHLKELYAKYKQDGFEILGIALEQSDKIEQNIAIWKKTVKEDQLPWLQVLDNQDRDKFDAVKAYGVTAFPTQILLDKEGKIIARYVGEGEDLDKKLEQLFGK